MRAAVQSNGLAVQFASQRLRADRSVLMLAVTNNGRALKFGLPKASLLAEVQRAAAVQVQTTLRAPVSFHLDFSRNPGSRDTAPLAETARRRASTSS